MLTNDANARMALETDPFAPWFATLCLEGEHDLASAPRLKAEVERVLEDRDLIIDLSNATFVDSSLLRELIRARTTAAQRGHHVVLQAGTAAVVDRALDFIGIEKALVRVRTRQEAIEYLRSRYLRRW